MSRKNKKIIEILVWCPTSPGGQIIPRWHGRPPPTFQRHRPLYTSFPPPPPPPLPPQHALAVATAPISRAPRLSHSLSTRPLASLLRFVPPPPPPFSRFR